VTAQRGLLLYTTAAGDRTPFRPPGSGPLDSVVAMPDPGSPIQRARDMELSDRQKRVAAAALTILSLVVIIAAVGAMFWLVARFLKAFSNVFLPLAVAGVAALVFRPYYDWLRTKLRLPTPLALLALFLSALLPLAAFGWFFGALIARQVSGMIADFPEWWQRLQTELSQQWPQVVEFLRENPLGQKIREALESRQDVFLQGLQFVGEKAFFAGIDVARGVGALLSWAVTPVYLVFFLIARSAPLAKLDEQLPFLKPGTRKDVVFLATEFVNIIVAFFRGQLIIAFLQGLLFAVGFSIAGLKFGLVLGLLLGFLNIIPYLGNIVGLGIALPLAYVQEGGGLWTLGAVLLVFVVVQLVEGYLLTPKIMGERTGLHPMAIIVAVFFWGSALNGILGMILAIPLTAFLVVFWRLAREKYIEEWV
jgi:predicted PurR-regulated permease PerM